MIFNVSILKWSLLKLDKYRMKMLESIVYKSENKFSEKKKDACQHMTIINQNGKKKNLFPSRIKISYGRPLKNS